MGKSFLIVVIILTVFAYSCDCGFFSGCPPSTEDLITEHFPQALGKPNCDTAICWAGGRDGYKVMGLLLFPPDVKREIIQTAQLQSACTIDPQCDSAIRNHYENYDDYDRGCSLDEEYQRNLEVDCYLDDFVYSFAYLWHRDDCQECQPEGYEGVWATYYIPDTDCTLFYHENSGKLYFKFWNYT